MANTSYPLTGTVAHYSTGQSASQAIRRATVVMEQLQAEGKHIVGGYLYTSSLEDEPHGFVFVVQD